MKKLLAGLVGLMVLSGCGAQRYLMGLNDGRKACIKGKSFKSQYWKGFYYGFLIQNFKQEDKSQ